MLTRGRAPSSLAPCNPTTASLLPPPTSSPPPPHPPRPGAPPGADLWICLICGAVGCGRYRGSHAASHWEAAGHGYALELETQRVWDYANDAYVHRLVASKTDGKLVEVRPRRG